MIRLRQVVGRFLRVCEIDVNLKIAKIEYGTPLYSFEYMTQVN